MFSELPASVVWFLTLIWGKFSFIIVLNTACVHFSLSSYFSISITCMLCPLEWSHSYWVFCSVCARACACCVLSYWFSSSKGFAWDILKLTNSLPAISSVLVRPSKSFFIFITLLLITSIYFSFFLRISIWCLPLPICSYMSTFPIKALTRLIPAF